MAKGDLPDALERRDVLYGKPKRTPDFQELGDSYVQVGRISDGIEAYEKIADEDARAQALARLRKEALKQGDHFLLNRLDGSLPLEAREWKEAAQAAKQAGKLQYALKSARRAEDDALVADLEQQLGIAKPAEDEAAEGAEKAEDEA